MSFITTLLLTFRLAAVTTALLFVLGLPLAYSLAHSRKMWKSLAEALISLPLVLPPTVIGFYLLLALGPEAWLGGWLLRNFDLQLLFSFGGLVLGSVFYSLPFMVQPLQAGFENLPPQLAEAAYTLGKSKWNTLWRVLLPNMRPAILSGLVLTFAHTVGEFGVVLMIGGNIPGVTRVASIAIYDEVESLHFEQAQQYALTLLLLSFGLMFLFFRYQGRFAAWKH
jgi:molybdate transport system permease protein